MMGIAIGGAPLLTLGCSPESTGQLRSTLSEPALYSLARQKGDARTVNSFLYTYPSSRLIPGLLDSMPPRALAGVSVNLIAALPESIQGRLSPRVRITLSQSAARTTDDHGSQRSTS